jgi:hypothetical protein
MTEHGISVYRPAGGAGFHQAGASGLAVNDMIGTPPLQKRFHSYWSD